MNFAPVDTGRYLFSIDKNFIAIINFIRTLYDLTENGTLNFVNNISSIRIFVSEESYRNITDDEAKKDIAELLLNRDHIYPSEVSDILHLPYSQTLRVMKELESEGAISFD